MAAKAARSKTLCERRLDRNVKYKIPQSDWRDCFAYEKTGTIMKSTEKDVIGSIVPALLFISACRGKSLVLFTLFFKINSLKVLFLIFNSGFWHFVLAYSLRSVIC